MVNTLFLILYHEDRMWDSWIQGPGDSTFDCGGSRGGKLLPAEVFYGIEM